MLNCETAPRVVKGGGGEIAFGFFGANTRVRQVSVLALSLSMHLSNVKLICGPKIITKHVLGSPE